MEKYSSTIIILGDIKYNISGTDIEEHLISAVSQFGGLVKILIFVFKIYRDSR